MTLKSAIFKVMISYKLNLLSLRSIKILYFTWKWTLRTFEIVSSFIVVIQFCYFFVIRDVKFPPAHRIRIPFLLKSLYYKVTLFGAFAKLRRATIGYVMSVRPSIRTEQLCFQWENFRENLIRDNFFSKNISRKFKLY